MLELTADNAAAYLSRHGRLGSGPFVVRELSGGVSNLVLRVIAPGGWYVLKQSRSQLRTADPWFSDPARVFREVEVMRHLYPLLPPGTVPEVLFDDPENFTFAMRHAPAEARDWRTVLLAGEVAPELGAVAGRLLGTIHAESARRPEVFAALHDATVFRQLRVEPFYERVRERHPDLAGAINPLVARMAGRRLALCHGDYSPKNLLLHAGQFTLVDYETAFWGDPAMDLGFFHSHLLLKALYRPDRGGRIAELVRAFGRGYAATGVGLPAAELRAAGIAHTGVCLLARVDGTSPAPYLIEPGQREAARRLGRHFLHDRPSDWDEVLARAEAIGS